ncbi:TPR-like protein [Eremomyces bilateralis CBS 781.70]|uniref:TPR-like protein n=1 Tax=Eremomyces bilateralis CBS 781.70 TaxID=1392243 RepID=A0A6G1GB41_9PEZI|nr:TPR-like protein [Eremomyces bilateralis CBS 781.70]KAF1815308.1 TPR-like protein [Eremomyces bilateralis CBS 781.70]
MPLSRNTDFFGRKATLDDLRDALLPQEPANDEVGKGTNNIKSFSILGPAGIGKTQVVIEFVHLHMHCFDAVFWIHADERSKIIEDVNKITKQLGLVDEASADSDDQILTRDLFKTWLENPVRTFASTSAQSRASWLLILDHVIDPKILDEFWPAKGETGSILITSRRNTLWNAATYPSGTLQPFTPEEAVDFIGILAQRDMSEEERQCARLISDKVKGYPLALKYLTGGIVEQNISFAEFLIQDHGRSAKRRRNINPVVRFIDNEEHSFLESAFDSISHSRPLLDVLSMLDPDHIPLDILKAPSTGFRLPGYPSTEQALRSSVQQLFKYSLVVKNKIPESLLMHRIVQDAARKQMEPDYYRAVFNACVTLISSKWPFREFTWRHGTSRWDQCEELLPHVMTLRGFASKHNTRMDDLHGAFAYARLVCDCGWYCHERGKTTESDMFGSIAQKICEELKQFYPLDLVNADKNPSEQQVADALAEILHNRGVVAVEVNWRRESLEHLTRFNEMMLQELGDRPAGQDMRLALSFNELGCAYMLRDNFEKGEECFQKSISSMEKLDNFEKWQISLPLVNLGFVYWLIGRNSEALDVLLEGLSVRERKFGYNDRESFITGRFLYALGNAYASLEMFDESLQYHGRALDHYRETLGSRHHRTADTYIRIADNFLRLKDGEHALALVEKAIQIYLSSAAFTAEAARARYWKSKVLRKLGQVKGAENEEKEALKLYREARQKFQDIMPEDKRPFEELEGVDFDRLIVFWSR